MVEPNSSQWEVQLQGEERDLEYLARNFASDAAIVVRDERDNSTYLLRSDRFNTCSTSDEVLNVASELLPPLSGVLILLNESRAALRPGSVHRRHANGNRDVFVHIHETASIRSEVGVVTVAITDAEGNSIPQPVSPPRTFTVFQLALNDSAVNKVLRLLAAPDARTWSGVYRVHEVIESDMGGMHAMSKCGWGSELDMKRFKHSANSVAVGGDAARHGKETTQPPSHPMTLDEAIAYVNYVIQAWLASKGV